MTLNAAIRQALLPEVRRRCVLIPAAQAEQLRPTPLLLAAAREAGENPEYVLLEDTHIGFNLMVLTHIGLIRSPGEFQKELQRLLLKLRTQGRDVLPGQTLLSSELNDTNRWTPGQTLGEYLAAHEDLIRHVRAAHAATSQPGTPDATWAWATRHLPDLLGGPLTPDALLYARDSERVQVSRHGALRFFQNGHVGVAWLTGGETRTLSTGLLTLLGVRQAFVTADDDMLANLRPARSDGGEDWTFLPAFWTHLENDEVRLAFDAPDAPALLRQHPTPDWPFPEGVRIDPPHGGWRAGHS